MMLFVIHPMALERRLALTLSTQRCRVPNIIHETFNIAPFGQLGKLSELPMRWGRETLR